MINKWSDILIEKFRIIYIIVFIIAFMLWLYYENNWLDVSKLEIKSKKLSQDFNDFKIVHISDLHGKYFGFEQEKILNIVRIEKPNIVVITGDLIDRRIYNEKPGLTLINKLSKIVPIYYVTGNHEILSGKFDSLQGKIIDNGANILRNSKEKFFVSDTYINIAGIDDYSNFASDDEYKRTLEILGDGDKNEFTILLSHRPEKLNIYSQYNFNLVFSGHAHGGQIRLPFVGGVLAPHQGFWPKITEGVNIEGNTSLVVSRGLGNSSIAMQRIFNKPEVVIVTLKN